MYNPYNTTAAVKSESRLGLIIMASLTLAIIVSNIPILYHYYLKFLFYPIQWNVIGNHFVDATPLKIMNDGLMSFFFLLIGLEMKYYMVDGEYQQRKKLLLPVMAALGGLIVPALIYYYFNQGLPSIKGWAIPIATDTAFILGIISFFRRLISPALKSFIITFSIIDDAFALLVLAIFYNKASSIEGLTATIIIISILFLLNRAGIKKVGYYLIFGVLLWIAMVASGIHGTLAGVIVALFIPTKINDETNPSFIQLESYLRPIVNYFILPVFIFFNCEIPLSNILMNSSCSAVSLGIILGLFIGKPVGISLFSYLTIKLGSTKLPADTSWFKFSSIAILGGVGFTLSLFIGGLAFESGCPHHAMRTAVILGSVLSALVGLILLIYLSRK